MAISGVGSVELGWQEWQRRAIPHIAWLAHSGGAGVDLKSPDWRYKGHRNGGVVWQNEGERDIIWFPENPPATEYKRIPGVLVPGDLTPDVALVDNVANTTDVDQPESFQEYERGFSVFRREVDEGKLGAAISAYAEAQGGGGEATGGSYAKVGTSTTLTAEYTHALETGNDKSQLTRTHIAVLPRARTISVIEQVVMRGEATVKIRERLIIDPAWQYIDWKHLRKGAWLNGNRDYSKWNGKSRILWKVENLAELDAQLHGRHIEYPGAHGHNLLAHPKNRHHFEWLMREGERTIESETTVTFDTVQQSDATIRYLSLPDGA